MTTIRIGAGAGFSGDRIEPAVDLAERGELDFLVFECLAERTIALAQLARIDDPAKGYDPLLARRLSSVLPACRRGGVRIVTNMGAANPLAAADLAGRLARRLGLTGLRIAAVTGDDVVDAVRGGAWRVEETGQPVAALGDALISANAYLGAGPIVAALDQGADIVITGRVADPALFLAPAIHSFGWAMDDWRRLGCGTLAGHLLECSAQITGGYFADPGYKDPPDLARLGFPIGEIDADGGLAITKLAGTGGEVTEHTCKEQLLYEVHDPSAYLQPDVVADFSGVSIVPDGRDRVRISGGSGRPRSGLLKVSLGLLDGWIGEGQISYAGPGAVERGRLAARIVEERLELLGIACEERRAELIGVDAILGPAAAAPVPREVRMRFAGRTETAAAAAAIGAEVEALYLCGPSGGGGVSRSTRRIVAMVSTLIPEDLAAPQIHMTEV
ncbi:MAG: DUF1446 domain-containing protein [Rhodospirillaceae bacterium]|nr:DUF1446 domain-containing protein [Rhodospirillaceae bacterium]